MRMVPGMAANALHGNEAGASFVGHAVACQICGAR